MTVEELIDEKQLKETAISEGDLGKEMDIFAQAAVEMLARQEKERLKNTITNPSALAVTTTKHSSGDGMENVKKTVRQLFNLYLTNQFVARAIHVRADTMVSKGFQIVGDDKNGVDACYDLIVKSGGIKFLWQLAVNTYIAGDGFLEKMYNIKKTKISRAKHVHPLTLRFKVDKTTNRIILGKDKEPVAYEQYYLNKEGVEVIKDVPKDRIAHFKFSILGDEFTGLSLIQPGYDTIVRLMNMEYSAAEAAIKTANPLWVGKCNTKSPHQIAQWGMILGNISGKDQLFIPQGMELEMKSPGNQNFNEYAEYFLDAVVACFGVPRAVLLGGGGTGAGNRAQEIVLTRHFYSSIRTDQKTMEDFFNEIFIEYAEINGFVAPELVFEDIAEDADLNAESAIKLLQAGIIDRDEAREMIGLDTGIRDKKVIGDKSLESEVKKSDRETHFPEEPGSRAGSQKGVKKKQKASQFSEFKGDNKPNVK